jgi:L-fucose isomerase-like protein
MRIGVVSLVSPLHDPESVRPASSHLLESFPNGWKPVPISPAQLPEVDLPLILIETGGTEHLFRTLYQDLKDPLVPITLLATGFHNSLPAAIEILSWLRQQGDTASVILHGPPEKIHSDLARRGKLLQTWRKLRHARIGILGNPSDWLIAGSVDYSAVSQRWGVGFDHFPIQAFVDQCARVPQERVVAVRTAIPDSWNRRGIGEPAIEEALRIYVSLRELVAEQRLDAVTVRCFDLVTRLKTTGCLALALLSQEGIVAGCESDVPAVLTLLVNQWLLDTPAFMANPSRIEEDGIILAHCTVPPDLVADIELQTHFETGLGVALKGTFPSGPATISRLGGNELDRFVALTGEMIPFSADSRLCRTQVKIHLTEGYRYFLENPLGNHHILVPGNHANRLSEFMGMFGGIRSASS